MSGHRFNPKKAELLIDPKREKLLSPAKMADLLRITQDDTIADLGAGNGFFSIPFAKMTKKKLIAVDIEPQMLEKLKGRAADEGVSNIEYVESSLEDMEFQQESVDKVITSLVLHEVKDLDQVLIQIFNMMKPKGRALIIEWEKVESESGPPLHERISSEELANTVKKLQVEASVHKINELQYGIVFARKKDLPQNLK
ncbi:class I SAM-dependent methyltransferase [Bacillus sp. DNRA2]|uniref:class I SAM-dependent methyltransferase n=1 Tax=Bacillus sp. DNRA2 TaxID=2723053 RepID=UPI00145EDBB7|nr:class I SAM-dependent methyltransferase [Bacillus sp. DNRA2]NMD71221.1 class I SAM-dependent methyltransferase [Bacillus sp. DNRA2]